MKVAGTGARGDEGALAAVLPASARRLWVDDPGLAGDLAGVGYDVGGGAPDAVVLTGLGQLAEAPVADVVVVLLDGSHRARPGAGRAQDAAARLGAHARVRAQVRAAHRRLTRQGHRQVRVLTWDEGVPVARGGWAASLRSAHRPQSFPRRAIMVAGKVDGPSLLECAYEQVSGSLVAAQPALGVAAQLSPGGVALLVTEHGLLRVGLARGQQQVDTPARTLALLARAGVPREVSDRVPALLARGRAGAASWSLEQRMPGDPARPALHPQLLAQCVDFLVALHRVDAPAPEPSTSTAVVAATLSAHPRAVRRLADSAAERVQELPRGFGHRDFWHRNLLVDESGRLSAVVDWDSAAGGTLPFLDLMHLVTTSALPPGGHQWGRAVAQTLLPWADAGADAQAERYAAALGVPVDRAMLRALVVTYWLDWVDYQVGRYAGRGHDPRWVRGNVDLVVDVLSDQR
jgi:aminoglycoside phosphotransferase (APT) family kinase protein